MSKKLIAIASAAALALAGLVSAPAFAVGLDVDADTNTKATAFEVEVPEYSELDYTDTTYRFDVTASEDDQTINFRSSEGVKFVIAKDFSDADANDPAISAGRTSYSKTLESEDDVVTVWAFTTSTTAGKLVITSGDNQNTYWVEGLVGGAYNMTVKFPSSVPTTGTGVKISAVVTDVFGNVITGGDNGNADGSTYSDYENSVDGDLDITLVGASIDGDSDNWTYDAKKKAWFSDEISADDSGPVAMRVDLNSDSEATPDGKPDLTDYGFAKAKATAFSSASALSLEDTIASLEAKLANTVSKAKYNNLVVKYNKITKGKKAKLVK